MSEQNIQSKSQLAKLLATENISFQHDPSARTAYFDVKNRILVLPVWQNISNDLYDMLVVHEVGHALDTPAEGWVQAIDKIAQNVHGSKNQKYQGAIKGFLNVVEDARIDKRQKRRYPGAKRNYIVGYKELIERDFFGTSKKNANDMSFIDRLNMYFKGGAMGTLGRIIFSKEEAPFVKRVENAETFEDVVALTEEIYRFSKDKGEEQQQQMEDFRMAEGEEDGDELEEGDDFDFDDEDFEETETDGSGSDEGDSEDDSEEEDGSPSDKKDEPKDSEEEEKGQTSNEGAGPADDDFVPQSETEKAWEENISNIVADDDINYVYMNIPKPNLNNIVDDYKIVLKAMEAELLSRGPEAVKAVAEEFGKFKAEENSTISYMVKEFESRKSAEAYSKISVAKTGVIDTNKLHSYRYNDDIFRRLATLPNGKNHGFIMFLDWSGSMIDNMSKTVKQLISLTMFCKRVQIPFEVYFFRDPCGNEGYGDNVKPSFDYEAKAFRLNNFSLRNILSSRMSLTDLNKAYNLLWYAGRRYSVYRCDSMGGTPLNQAIVAAEGLVNDFRKRNKLEIVNTVFLTDGDSNCVGYPDVSNTPYKPKGNRYILKDDVMKKEYNLGKSLYSDDVTNSLLRILKDRTDSNLIGFFLSSDSLRHLTYRLFGYGVDITKYTESWKKNKFLLVQSKGYDDYYIINAKEMDISKLDYSIDTDNMSRAKMAKEFMKFSEKKSVNRVLLSRFIEKISSQSKKVA